MRTEQEILDEIETLQDIVDCKRIVKGIREAAELEIRALKWVLGEEVSDD